MRLILAVPHHGPTGKELLREFVAYGFKGVRVDVHPDDHELNWAQVKELSEMPMLFPIFLLAGGTMTRSDGKPWTREGLVAHSRDFAHKLHEHGFFSLSEARCAIEIGNEPDLAHRAWKGNARELGKVFSECYDVLRAATDTTPILCPSISNLDLDSLAYLERMEPELPGDCGVAFHRYPAHRDFDDAHRGFADRAAEMFRLSALAKGRKLWNTETGYAEINKRYQLTEKEVADRMAEEVLFHEAWDCESFTCYQSNSSTFGPGDDDDAKRLKSYGFRRPDGSWKPVAAAVQAAKDGLA